MNQEYINVKNLMKQAVEDFVFFHNNIFSKSFTEVEPFQQGSHLNEWCRMLQERNHTCILAPRKHSKSVSIYSWLMWQHMLNQDRNLEVLYLSYKKEMASYHVRRYKEMVENNLFFNEMRDLTPAEGIGKYKWPTGYKHIVEPEGILSFKRGRHPDMLILDDVLMDPTTQMELGVIQKINQRVKEEALSMVKEGGPIKIIGTAQTPIDFFFDMKKNPEFNWGEFPAIKDYKKKIVLWPQKFPWVRLMHIKNFEIGEKAFQKEYMIKPVWSADSFFSRPQIEACVNVKLMNQNKIITKNKVGAGWDIGKHSHPAHFTVFEFTPIGKGMDIAVQRFQIWMDKWDYSKQLEFIKPLIHNLRVDYCNFDNTRGELEGFMEKGDMDRGKFFPINFSTKTKHSMAAEFERRVTYKTLKQDRTEEPFPLVQLINHQRMINQILTVTNDLDAVQTHEGHGDCVDEQTEFLTINGWKYGKELDYEDKFATLNKEGFVEYQKPSDIIKKNYKGKMYEIENTQISMLVNPRHKLYVPNQKKKLKFPREIFHKQVKFKKNAEWKGFPHTHFCIGSELIRAELWMEFLGYYIAEGHTTKRERGRYQIGISQEGDKRNKIRECLKKLPYKFTENKKGFWIYKSELGKILHPLGKSHNKYIPHAYFESSKELLQILFEALMYGDGTKQKTFSNYYTSSKFLAGQIQEILLKIGLSGNIYVRDFKGRKAPHGITRRLHYQISVITNKNEPMINKKKNSGIVNDRWVDYEGKIYCVTVPNHVIYVRRNGKPCWTGNSFWSIGLALKRTISGEIALLEDKDNVMGLF